MSADSFWRTVREAAERLEHSRNLSGKTTAKCTANRCDNGVTERGYTDYDGYGSIWRESEHCRVCGGSGRVEVACAPEVEARAVEAEIEKLKARLRELRKRMRKAQ